MYREIKKGNYEFEIFWPSSQPLDPENEAVDVIVRAGNEEYTGTVITPRHIGDLFEKNRRTGECADGSYFCMPRIVIVRRIDRDTIKKTLDDLIKEGEFHTYFK